jgi:hypothetical protein
MLLLERVYIGCYFLSGTEMHNSMPSLLFRVSVEKFAGFFVIVDAAFNFIYDFLALL